MCIRDRRYALAMSLNNATVKVAEEIGYDKVANLAKSAGITSVKATPVSYTHLDVYKRQEIVVAPVNVKDETVRAAAEDIAQRLQAAGYDVILDDRDERPGVKFKDADLVGIPFRITVGKKVTEGTVELVLRSTREVRDVRITAIVETFKELLRRAG